MGKFKEYFERAKSSGLDETIKVPNFESKSSMLEWLEEISRDVDLEVVIARDDVYDPITEDIMIAAGDYLSELKIILESKSAKEMNEASELMSARGGWSPTMKQYMAKTSVSPEQRKREKAGDKAIWEGERKKTEHAANKYLKRLKDVEDDERSSEYDKKEKKRQNEFKNMSTKKLSKELESMGYDMAGDALYDLGRQNLDKNELTSEFNHWASTAAEDAADNIYGKYADPHDKKNINFLKNEGIKDASGWAADCIHDGMQKYFNEKIK